MIEQEVVVTLDNGQVIGLVYFEDSDEVFVIAPTDNEAGAAADSKLYYLPNGTPGYIVGVVRRADIDL